MSGYRCPTWQDHDWRAPRLVEEGRHDTRGPFHRYEATCRNCDSKTTETRWLDIPATIIPRLEIYER